MTIDIGENIIFTLLIDFSKDPITSFNSRKRKNLIKKQEKIENY